MRLFLSEYLCSGALAGEPLSSSLLREGRAMRDALAADFAAITDVSVVTTCDPRTPVFGDIDSIVVESPDEERQQFERLCQESDAVLIIAPELGGLLGARCRIAAEFAPQVLNCAREMIDLCSDKLALAEHLQKYGVPTIPTWPLPLASTADAGSVGNETMPSAAASQDELVVKPRHGAGSQSTWVCRSHDELIERLTEFRREWPDEQPIVQPFIPGRTLSFAALFDLDSGCLNHLLPVAEQQLTDDGRLQYRGGTVPASNVDHTAIVSLVNRTIAAPDILSGGRTSLDSATAERKTTPSEETRVIPNDPLAPLLRGYVGFDFIILDSSPTEPILVEINPRLTTSYVGYRWLCRQNLAAAMLGNNPGPLEWADKPIAFDADGTISSTVNWR